jgi:DNA-binding transcriptional MerR regulator
MMDYDVEYSISEVAEITGYASHVLRYYEKEFEIEVPRKESNHRYYTYREIELIQYIKMLQDKGFGNKQIKLIISSPELVMTNPEETSLEVVENNKLIVDNDYIAREISSILEESFLEKISQYIDLGNKDSVKIIMDLKEEIINLRIEMNSKERDILISENARLKMKVMEINNENLKIKIELEKLKNNSTGFFKRIFSLSKSK